MSIYTRKHNSDRYPRRESHYDYPYATGGNYHDDDDYHTDGYYRPDYDPSMPTGRISVYYRDSISAILIFAMLLGCLMLVGMSMTTDKFSSSKQSAPSPTEEYNGNSNGPAETPPGNSIDDYDQPLEEDIDIGGSGQRDNGTDNATETSKTLEKSPYYVQVGAFNDYENATQEKWNKDQPDHPAVVAHSDQGDGLYRVLIGGYATYAEAKAVSPKSRVYQWENDTYVEITY